MTFLKKIGLWMVGGVFTVMGVVSKSSCLFEAVFAGLLFLDMALR